ncbi:MAG: M1 family aminopeptidase, partial [Bacteroidia bacterium]
LFSETKKINDTSYVNVYYNGQPVTDNSGWGGFYFDNHGGNEYAYNLGVGFQANPHNYGRVWHPCFDNFVERSAYHFYITCDTARKSFCNGYLNSESINGAKRTRHWIMNDEIPTYLASIAVAKYKEVNMTIPTLQGPKPAILAAVAADTVPLKNSFINLANCSAGFENYYGPYVWNRFGYCLVPFNSGAMEHATSIAYPRAVIGNLAYESLMAHELSHHWWGDLITCETMEDMWINEGWASYSELLFSEWQYGYNNYITEYRNRHDILLKQTHHKEGGFRAVSGIPHNYTYGDHVYKKGADVAHNLRTYMGDTPFFNAIKYVMNQNAMKSINSTQLRDLMQTSSGQNLQNFFDNWVFNGGWPHFNIDSVRIINQSGNSATVSVGVRQKVYGAPSLFSNVPLEITFFKNDWTKTVESFTFSGGSTQQFTFAVPFVPASSILNYDCKIGDAVSYDTYTIKTNVSLNFLKARLRLTVTNAGTDSNFVYVSHNFVKPDAFKSNPNGALLSDQHFWKVDGIWSSGFVAKARFTYDGNKSYASTNGYLDTLLTRVNGDSIRLYHRVDAGDDWKPVTNFIYNNVTAKYGYIEIDTLQKGEYTFANFGDTTTVIGVKEIFADGKNIKVYPNPAKNNINVDLTALTEQHDEVQLKDINGRLIKRVSISEKKISMSVQDYPKGVYFIEVKNMGESIGQKKIMLE